SRPNRSGYARWYRLPDSPESRSGGMTARLAAWSSHVAVRWADRSGRPFLHGCSVRHRLLWRPQSRPDVAAPAPLGLQPVAGVLSELLYLLRRGRARCQRALLGPADRAESEAAVVAGASGVPKDDPDQQAGEEHHDARLLRRALLQVI